MSVADIYPVVERFPEITDALVIPQGAAPTPARSADRTYSPGAAPIAIDESPTPTEIKTSDGEPPPKFSTSAPCRFSAHDQVVVVVGRRWMTPEVAASYEFPPGY
ncbi:hypothetical protein ACLMAJ_02760 [Nocardia sp. KC 131]|uniref:hypothetical protein n=1 Tax=Nocardia arseniciresistens TaxID=3392119 RepID=UPI00398E9574